MDLLPAAVDAKDMRSARNEFTEVLAADAMAVCTLFVEEPHSVHPVWMYSIAPGRERAEMRTLGNASFQCQQGFAAGLVT